MLCPICGKEHSDVTKFCPIFGQPIPLNSLTPPVCPECKAEIQPDWGACPECGRVLNQFPLEITKEAGGIPPSSPVLQGSSEGLEVAPIASQNDLIDSIEPPSHVEDNQITSIDDVSLNEIKPIPPVGIIGPQPVPDTRGSNIEDFEAAPAYCPNCGKPIQAHWKICANCGNKLKVGRRKWINFVAVLLGIGSVILIAIVGVPLVVKALLPANTPTSTPTPPATITQTSTPVPKAQTQTPTLTATITHTATPSPSPSKTLISNFPLPVTLVTERVSSTREAGSFNAIAFDANGTPLMVYLKENDDRGINDKDQLFYSRRQNNYWTFQALTDGSKNEGYVNSLAADQNGNLHLSSYSYEEQRIFYGIKRGTAAWNIRSIYYAPRGKDQKGTTNVVPPISLAIDLNGNPCIAFLDMVNNRLMYLSPRSQLTGDWQPRVVALGVGVEGYSFPMVVGTDGQPVIAFYNSSGTNKQPAGLQVARFSGSEWKIEAVDPNPSSSRPVGLFPSLAKGNQGQLYLAYFDSYQTALKFIVFDGKNWQLPMIVDPRGGQYTSMAVDKDGLIHIAYYDQSTQTLKYVVGSSAGFNQPIVLQPDVPLMDANLKETKSINIALDPSGRPWISFFDPSDMILKIFRPSTP